MAEAKLPPTSKSTELFERAQQLFPGGVNSPARAFGAVGGSPRFISSASGAHVTDVDGNTYIDYVGSWGPMIGGHAHPHVVEAIQHAAARGSSYGAPTEAENILAEMLIERMPAIERIRFVSSGTEASMSALRLARAATGRDRIVKFNGCYHGHVDSLLVSAGSGVLTLGKPDSPGVPEDLARLTTSLPYNDLAVVEEAFVEHGAEIAAVIVEPVAGNMGVIEPGREYLAGLREITARHGALLIFDEVITGCRIARGGAQERYAIDPDLTIMGKIIGGGLPVGAYGGRADIMDQIAPTGSVYQAGTLSGNPLAMAAGTATLQLLDRPGVYDELESKAAKLSEGLAAAARQAEIPVQLHRVGAMMTLFFNDQSITDETSAKISDTSLYARYFNELLNRGVYFAPSQFECAFPSLAHEDADIEATTNAAAEVMLAIAD